MVAKGSKDDIPCGFDGYYLIDRHSGRTLRRKNLGSMTASQKSDILPLELHALILFVATNTDCSLRQMTYGNICVWIVCDEKVACVLFGDCIPDDIGAHAAAMILAGEPLTHHHFLDLVAKSALGSMAWILAVSGFAITRKSKSASSNFSMPCACFPQSKQRRFFAVSALTSGGRSDASSDLQQ